MSGKFYVYVFFDESGTPIYVGKGTGKRDRRYHPGPKVRVREGITENEAFETERALIRAIGRKPNGPLLNLSDGGEGISGYRYTVEQRARVSAGAKRRGISPETIAKMIASPTRGRFGPHTEETKAKISRKKTGHPVTEEMRAKIKAARVGQNMSVQVAALRVANTGRHPGPKVVERIGALWRGKKLPDEHKAKLRGPRGRRFHTPDGRISYIAFAPRDPADLPGMGDRKRGGRKRRNPELGSSAGNDAGSQRPISDAGLGGDPREQVS